MCRVRELSTRPETVCRIQPDGGAGDDPDTREQGGAGLRVVLHRLARSLTQACNTHRHTPNPRQGAGLFLGHGPPHGRGRKRRDWAGKGMHGRRRGRKKGGHWGGELVGETNKEK